MTTSTKRDDECMCTEDKECTCIKISVPEMERLYNLIGNAIIDNKNKIKLCYLNKGEYEDPVTGLRCDTYTLEQGIRRFTKISDELRKCYKARAGDELPPNVPEE